MSFNFIGNSIVVSQFKHLVAEGRARRTLILSGPDGVGKTRLAFLFGLALNCQAPTAPGEFCGTCSSCAQAVPLDTVPEAIEAALAYRAAEVKGNAREAAPLCVALHPAIRLYPPDGDLLTMPQARAIIHQCQLQPDAGRTWTLIVPGLDQARWMTQSALLKTLEEPPPGVTIVALARNPLAVLPTVRSRALSLALAPVPVEELAAALAARGLPLERAQLTARLAQGCPGRALRLDLTAYQQARAEALRLLATGWDRPNPGAGGAALVFRLSESIRANKEKFETLLEILYSVLQDIIYLQSEFPEAVRNVDCAPELSRLAQRIPPASLIGALEDLDQIPAAARRNAFRPLAVASWALSLGNADPAGR